MKTIFALLPHSRENKVILILIIFHEHFRFTTTAHSRATLYHLKCCWAYGHVVRILFSALIVFNWFRYLRLVSNLISSVPLNLVCLTKKCHVHHSFIQTTQYKHKRAKKMNEILFSLLIWVRKIVLCSLKICSQKRNFIETSRHANRTENCWRICFKIPLHN